MQFKANKIIYRRYAGLYFSMCVDVTDNELAYLESIHLFVEILDHFFSNVCELDLVFNFHKVCLGRLREGGGGGRGKHSWAVSSSFCRVDGGTGFPGTTRKV